LNQQSEFTFYKLVLCLLQCLDGESSSGESSETDEVNEFFQCTKSLSPNYALECTWPVTEMSSRSRKIMFLGNEVWPVCRAENRTSICELIV
jgi:hypothetical protein